MSKSKLAMLLATIVVFLVTGIAPKDRFTWFLEVVPAMIGIPLLVWVDMRVRVTPVLYFFVCLHAMVLCLGGMYTYAEVPLGFWAQEAFGFARNHYDRLGHFFQGFVPALLTREILLRREVLRRGFFLGLFCVCAPLAFSAFYEMIEWWTAVAQGSAADAFLGTQGDVWDTQWDMFMAMVGAITATLILPRWHDRQLADRPSGDHGMLAALQKRF